MIFAPKPKPIMERCEQDAATRLRLRYDPYYHAAETCNGSEVTVDGRAMVMMSSNEYLGLSHHPKVIAAAQAATAEWGTSSCGSRLANGSRGYHLELESELAAFLGVEACHVTSAGYLACMAGLSALVQRGDSLIVDPGIHSALWDGALLSGAKIERFAHQDMAGLAKLFAALDPKSNKAIVVDGVYSMEGHIAPLPQICDVADQFRAAVIVDDAHGIGVLGREGRGTCDHLGVTERVDLIVGSFSKSLASTGGFLAGRRSVVEYLRSNSRQIIFSAALGAGAAAAALTALRILRGEPEHRARLWENYHYLRGIFETLKVDFWHSPTPALPIVIGDREKCYSLWKALWEEGFFTVISMPPAVPAGKDLLRIAVNASHTRDQLDRFGNALAKAMKRVGCKVG